MTQFTTKVLDHGFVTLRNIAGPTRRTGTPVEIGDPDSFIPRVFTTRDFDADDTDPANAARMSFDMTDSNRTREADLKLCRYLMSNIHTSPFEMIEVWLEMKLPIFVARQFVRHRTVSINEVSGRYITLPAEWYIPEIVGGKAPSKKQGQEDNLSAGTQERFKDALSLHCQNNYAAYLAAMNEGVAPEHARMFLNLNHYTHWLWKQDLHNMMHFLALRDRSHAQVEAQAYAKAIDAHIRSVLPNCMALYDEFRRRT
jgi:thymidylate synthase (FAD)